MGTETNEGHMEGHMVMSLKSVITSETKVTKLWKKISGGAFDYFLHEIEASLMEGYESLIQEKSETLIGKLWEIQLEQGFNTLNETFFYPTGTKFFYHTKQSTIVVIEQSPTVRTINANTSGLVPNVDAVSSKRYAISLPYVTFVFLFIHSHLDKFRIETCGCFFANESLKSMQTKVAYAALPNIHANGSICFGGSNKDFCKDHWDTATSENLIQSIENAIAFFWGSSFNAELDEHYEANNLRFDDWDALTKQDPNFILNIKWKKQMPFGKILQCLPGMEIEPIRELTSPNTHHLMMLNDQLDDVYCKMMTRSRAEVKNTFDSVKGTYEFGGLEECFHAIVNLAARKAHEEFFNALERNIEGLPLDRRAEVEKCIEKSLKSAMMAIQ